MTQRNRFFSPSLYTPLGLNKDFQAKVTAGEIELPKWDWIKVGQIAEKVEKQVLADTLQAMLVERDMNSGGALVVNEKDNLADCFWYECFIHTLDPDHPFFDRNFTYKKEHPGHYEP